MKSGSVVHKSGNNEWRTPSWLYSQLNDQFNFGLDAAADDENHLAPAYFTAGDSALTQSWKGFGNVFLNPPYSKTLCKAFIGKAAAELDGSFYIVLVIASRTSNAWWHDHIMKLAHLIGFIRGRVKFVGAPTGAPFPSCVVVLRDPLGIRDLEAKPIKVTTIEQYSELDDEDD